jgi:DNA-binding Xre family transcriptional regulator
MPAGLKTTSTTSSWGKKHNSIVNNFVFKPYSHQMKTRQFIFNSLRAHLKARKLTYRDIAQELGLSEQTMKRLFLHQDCSIERLEKICDLMQLDLRELVKSSPRPRKFIQQLTLSQEDQLAQNHKLLMVAVCAMSLWTVDDMVQHLYIPDIEIKNLLHQLDKMAFLDLLPSNRYHLRVAREFAWIVDGPIMRMVKNMAGDYFNHFFDGDGEILKVINVRVSRPAASRLRARLEQIAQEYADQVNIDAHLPLHERPPLSICIAARRWLPEQLQALMSSKA